MTGPTTGLESVDELIGGLQIGDNVVVQASSQEAVTPLLAAALGAAAGQDHLVYVTFRESPRALFERFGHVWDRERFVLLDCREEAELEDVPGSGMRVERPAEGVDPAAVSRALLRMGLDWGPGTSYIIDGLADVMQRWDEAAALDLFLSTCPGLYQQRTIAYWVLHPDTLSWRSVARLEQITQVMLEVRAEESELVIELRKAAGRPVKLRGGRLHAVVDDDQLRILRRLVGTRERAGELVRQRREALGLSQAELARRVGITASALSQAERGAHGLSGEVLTRVWEAMDVPFGPTSSATRPPLQVFRRGRTSTSMGDRLQVETIVETADLGAHLVRVPPDASGSGPPFATKQREFLTVLDGVLELRVGQTIEVLQAGDAALITGQPVAAWSNPGTLETRALWIILP